MVVRRRIDGHDLQAQTPDPGDAYVDVFGGRLPGHHATLVQLLTVAPHLEEDAPKGADLVIDPDLGGERLARPVRSKLQGRRRMAAKSPEVGDPVQRERAAIPRPAPAVARISFDRALLVRHVCPRLVAEKPVRDRRIRADDPEQGHPMCGYADAVLVRERTSVGAGP